MLPESNTYMEDLLDEESEWLTIESEPSATYQLSEESHAVSRFGACDGQAAIKQAILMILRTERDVSPIYGEDYGLETGDLYGLEVEYAAAVLESRISEALIYDDRIEGVSDFEAEIITRNRISVSFTVNTSQGDIWIEREELGV